MNVKISVIVPVYNAGKYLERCLKSLVEQSLQDIEIIVVNDGSDDNSSVIAENYKRENPNIQVKHLKENRGVSNARNIGIEISTGEFITFVDGDDWVEDFIYEKLYEVAKIECADIAMCGIKLFTARGIVEKKFSNDVKVMNCMEIHSDLIPFLCEDSIIGNSPCNKIYSRNLLRTHNVKFPIDLKRSEDLEFNRQVVPIAKKIVMIPETFYIYYLLNNSAMRSSIKNFHEIYLENRVRSLTFMKKHELMSAELIMNLNNTLLKNLLLEVIYNCSYSVNKSFIRSYSSIGDILKIQTIHKVIKSQDFQYFGLCDRFILHCLKKERVFFVLLYGLLQARVLLPLKDILRRCLIMQK
jgi:glycosyltransferase involved in cell wall biosynthesis